MLAGRNSRTARRTMLVTAVTAAFTIGAMGAALSAQANSNDALKQAQAKYKTAQNKCIKHHQLKQLPHILKLADKIKKLGGSKIKKKQLYKCLVFTLSFRDDLSLKGSEHTDVRTITHNWTYGVHPLVKRELHPDFKDAARDFVSVSGVLFEASPFSGSATYQTNGSDTKAIEKAAGPVKGDQAGYAATMFINPSAKDPRKTIDLSISASPALERYSLKHSNGETETPTGQVWLAAFNWVHRTQKDPAPFTRCNTTNFNGVARGLPDGTVTVASQTVKTETSMPLSKATDACKSPNGYRTFPITAYEDPWEIKSLQVTDTTSYDLEHTP